MVPVSVVSDSQRRRHAWFARAFRADFASAVVLALVFAHAAFAGTGDDLAAGFADPPDSARPHVWWHWMNGHVSKEGITADLEALKAAGIGGAQIFDVGCNVPKGKVAFNSPEWIDCIKWAAQEARRLGLELAVHNCSGWSSSGGPWNTPENSMKFARTVLVPTKGPMKFDAVLPKPEKTYGFYRDVAVIAFPKPPAEADGRQLKLAHFMNKTLTERGETTMDTAVAASDQVVRKEDEIDLTEKMDASGHLVWDVPAGEWTILRFGYASAGKWNHPASATGGGPECDKLDAAAVSAHFDGYAGKLAEELGPLAGNVESGLNNILIDSYEVGGQTWTHGFEKSFEARRGYSIKPYLPVLARKIVGSVEESERFLWDFRRHIADLFAENYAGTMQKRCHEKGFTFSCEAYCNSPSDDLQYARYVDIPMGEFWQGDTTVVAAGWARSAASAAHFWGKPIVGAEAFTATAKMGRWLETPYSIKPMGDRFYSAGVNRIIYHRFVHQPWKRTYLPGMTMGEWGMHFDRTQTWWKYAGAFTRCQARCQFLLQRGEPVADILFFCGDSAPNDGMKGSAPTGYKSDDCSADGLAHLKVDPDGRLVAPSGIKYRLMALPNSKSMTLATLAELERLAAAGATVVGKKPLRTPGLEGWPQSEDELKRRVDALWAKPNVADEPVGSALARLGAEPDFTTTDNDSDIAFCHRRYDDGTDAYFVSHPRRHRVDAVCTFRSSGRLPELWNPETGAITPAAEYREKDGRTELPLSFDPEGSVFVVFRKPDAAPHVTSVALDPKPAARPSRPFSIIKAEYGLFSKSGSKTFDVTEKLQSILANDGRLVFKVNNALCGGKDPATNNLKAVRIEYKYGGELKTDEYQEWDIVRLPKGETEFEFPQWNIARGMDGRTSLTLFYPAKAVVEMSDGSKAEVAADSPPPLAVEGPWRVEFPVGWYGGGSEVKPFVWPRLKDWSKDDDPDVRYFSGTAVYKCKVENVKCKAIDDSRIVLDLGDVRNFAEVTVDGKTFPVLWHPPYCIDITEAAEGRDSVDVEIKVTNLWPNRLIGDEQLPDDRDWGRDNALLAIPEWVEKGETSPTGRKTFATWHHWKKDSALLPSGLLGPVTLKFGVVEPLKQP